MISSILGRLFAPGRQVAEPGAEVQLPPTITLLSQVDSLALSHEDQLVRLLMNGKAALIAGLSLIGDTGYVVRSVAMCQTVGPSESPLAQIRGWAQCDGHPKRRANRLKYLDSTRRLPETILFPNLMVHLIAEVDRSLLSKDADRAKLLEVINYAMAQIHD